MEIIYCHHAERKRDKSKPLEFWQEEDITEFGEQDAELFAKMMNKAGQKITAVYTSVYKRCKRTAEIVNKYAKAPIFDEPRFNEFRSIEGETWTDCQNRTIAAIKDIVAKHGKDDVILCVTSGVNLSAFMCWRFGIEPSEKTPYLGVASCSPIFFRLENT